jgi:integrase/recombinase XerC
VDEVTTRRRVGDANPRGALLKPEGPFLLRDGLKAPGAMPLGEALDLVAAEWKTQAAAGAVTPGVVTLYTRFVLGLFRTLERQGIALVSEVTPNHVWLWMRAPSPRTLDAPTPGVMGVRRAAVRMFFQTAFLLGITDANPANSVMVSGTSARYVHPFTDGEIHVLKQTSRHRIGETRIPAALALCLSGASSTEVSFVTVDDVDLANQRVWLHSGGYRQRDRWVPMLDDWCVEALTKRVEELRATYGRDAGAVWLIHKPHSSQPTPTRQGTAAAQRLTELLKRARVYREGVTRVESIREWLALRVFEATGSVEEVACRLGMSSLDHAAHLVGHEWVEVHGILDGPPAHRLGDAS